MTYRQATDYYEHFDRFEDPQVAAMLALTQAMIDHREDMSESMFHIAEAIRNSGGAHR